MFCPGTWSETTESDQKDTFDMVKALNEKQNGHQNDYNSI